MGDRPSLGYLLGVRDLVLGAGLLRSEGLVFWIRVPPVSDAVDAVLLAGGAASSAFPRKCVTLGSVVAASFAAFGFARR